MSWLRLYRAHSAPLSVLTLTTTALLAGADWETLAWLFIGGTIAHYAGFGMNSVLDCLHGYDKRDPAKQHHPLQRGEIDPVAALWMVGLLTILGYLFLATPALQQGDAPALLVLGLTVITGYMYNIHLDHLTPHSWIPISLYTGLGALYGYLLGPNATPTGAILVFTSFLLFQVYQIAWEGNLKDLENWDDRAPDLLRAHCYRYPDGLWDCRGMPSLLFLATRLAYYPLAGLLAWASLRPSPWLVALLLTAALAATVRLHLGLHTPLLHGTEKRRLLKRMAYQEIVALYYLIALTGLARPLEALLLAAYGLIYYLAMTRILWGEPGLPRV